MDNNTNTKMSTKTKTNARARVRRLAMAAHPSAAVPCAAPHGPPGERATGPEVLAAASARGEEGSVVAEYGLVAIVGATIASLAVKWATGGAIWQLFDAVMDKVRVLLGA